VTLIGGLFWIVVEPILSYNIVSFRLLPFVCRKTHLDLSSHSQESLLDVCGILGRGFEERNAETVGELFGNSILDNLLVRHIALVSDQKLVDTVGGVPVNLLQPLLDVVETIHVCNVEDDADTVSTSVV
jgi:hypothetical protein